MQCQTVRAAGDRGLLSCKPRQQAAWGSNVQQSKQPIWRYTPTLPLTAAVQQQPRQCAAQAGSKPDTLETAQAVLTANPVGKALSGVVGTPVFLGMELVALLVLLGLTDAGYSGDWSRIGAITKDTELLLQKLTLLAWALHGVTGLLAANIAGSRGRSPAVAGVKGVLFGALGVFEQLVLPAAAGTEGEGGEQGQQR